LEGYAGVYARISYFYDWIVETACDNYPDEAPPYMNCFGSASTPSPSTNNPTFLPSAAPSWASSSTGTNTPAGTMTSTGNSTVSSLSINQLQFVAWSPNALLQACQGDCDTNDDCEGDLVCFQRNGNNFTFTVPGCEGPESIEVNVDICVNMSALNDAP
jgi:hypothetical protein